MLDKPAMPTIKPAQGVFIDNAWRKGSTGRTVPVYAPAEGKIFAELTAGSAADVDLAVAAARKAVEGGAWSRLTATERGRILSKVADRIAANFDELSLLEARDTGKPMKQAKADIVAVQRYFEYYGGAADKLHGDTLPFLDGYFVATLYEPHGVTAHIIPWNYPAQMFGRTVAPALAMGNAAVVKPAEEACLTVLRLAELCAEAGLPEGALNVVPGLGEEAGAALSSHGGIDFMSFTGSPEVGTLIQMAAARNHIGCTLELGGKSAQVVFADADLDAVLPVLVNGIIQNAGQTCSAGARALVQRPIYDKVAGLLAERFAKLQCGTPEMDLDLGPVISATQKKRVESFIARSAKDKIAIVGQGSVAKGAPSEGFFVPPIVYGHVPRDHTLACDEVFGPVMAMMPFDDEADAIRLANATQYGLVGGVWSHDGSRAMRVARKIRAGQLFINGYGAGGGIELPFGGMKKSGHGREKGFEALYEFGSLKTIVMKHG
jgi:aldehyde dehydrogenase (NAD+)